MASWAAKPTGRVVAAAMLLCVVRHATAVPLATDLRLWLRADAGVYKDAGATPAADGEAVQQWNDQLLGDNTVAENCTASSAAARPTYVASGLGGMPVLHFDGNDRLDGQGGLILNSGTAARTVVVVASSDSASDAELFGLNRAWSGPTAYVCTNELGMRQGAGNTMWEGDPLGATHAIVAMQTAAYPNCNTGHTQGFKNSTTPLTPSSIGSPDTAMDTGSGGYSMGRWAYLAGDIAEVLVYERLLSTTELNGVGYYLQDKYGIAASFTPPPPKRIFDNGGSGSDWGTADNWHPDQEPTALDDAYVGGGHTAAVTQSGEAASSLFLGHNETTEPGAGTLNVSGGSLTITGDVVMGHSSSWLKLTGGTMNVAGNITGGTGTVQINADEPLNLTASIVEVATFQVGQHADGAFTLGPDDTLDTARLTVGEYSGTGEFIQDGGTVTVGTSNMVLGGNDATGVGTYTVRNNATLTIASELNIGNYGTGTFNLESGDVDVTGIIRTSTSGSTGEGVIHVSGGTLDGQIGIWIGDKNTASGGDGPDLLIVSGGTVTTPQDLLFGRSGGKGKLNLSGSGVVNVRAITKGSGTGTINVDGGTLNVATGSIDVTNFNVGPTTTATYTCASGTLSTANLTLGGAGDGTLRQTGGTVNVASTLSFATISSLLEIRGGTANVSGNVTGGKGIIELESGTTSTNSLNLDAGASVSVDLFHVGYSTGATGAFTLHTGQTLTTNRLMIGDAGTGQFIQQAGTTVNVPGAGSSHNVVVGGNYTTGDGTYTMQGGTLTIGDDLNIGNDTTATSTFDQQDGTVTVGDDMQLAYDATGHSRYLLKSGSLTMTNAARDLCVGIRGVAEFTQTGGTATMSRHIVLGTDSTGSGTYNLSGGTLDLDGGNITRGAGAAAFHFTGGRLQDVGTFGFALGNTGTGTLAPGGSAGTTIINGDYTQGADATLEIEIEDIALFDFVDVNGTATLGGTLQVILGGYTPEMGDQFVILHADTLAAGEFDILDDSQAPLPETHWYWHVYYDTAAGDVVLQVLPEPTSLALLALGGLGLLTRRRRR